MLYDNRSLVERIASRVGRLASNARRCKSLPLTAAASLKVDHLTTLELCRLIPPETVDTIWDVGANRGTWSVLATSLFPNAAIYAFEPLPEMFSELVARKLPNVNCIPLALGASDGECELHVTSNLDSSSLLSPTSALTEQFGVREVSKNTVQLTRADKFIAKNQLRTPSLVKMDVQGFEKEVLKGFGSSLPHVQYLILELAFLRQYECQPLAGELISYLHAAGFNLIALSRDCVTGRRLVETDALFERFAE